MGARVSLEEGAASFGHSERIAIGPDEREIRMDVPVPWTVEELQAEVRAFIFLEDDTDEGVSRDPEWADDMLEVLREHGIAANEESLASLPFVVEFDDTVPAALNG
jgi:hypothetical protein